MKWSYEIVEFAPERGACIAVFRSEGKPDLTFNVSLKYNKEFTEQRIHDRCKNQIGRCLQEWEMLANAAACPIRSIADLQSTTSEEEYNPRDLTFVGTPQKPPHNPLTHYCKPVDREPTPGNPLEFEVIERTAEEVANELPKFRKMMRVPQHSLRKYLLSIGKYELVCGKSIDMPTDLRIEWDHLPFFERTSKMTDWLQSALGYSDSEMDTLFGEAFKQCGSSL
jgi:hypothetical protein